MGVGGPAVDSSRQRGFRVATQLGWRVLAYAAVMISCRSWRQHLSWGRDESRAQTHVCELQHRWCFVRLAFARSPPHPADGGYIRTVASPGTTLENPHMLTLYGRTNKRLLGTSLRAFFFGERGKKGLRLHDKKDCFRLLACTAA